MADTNGAVMEGWGDEEEDRFLGEDAHDRFPSASALTVGQKLTNLANRLLHDRGCSLFYVGTLWRRIHTV